MIKEMDRTSNLRYEAYDSCMSNCRLTVFITNGLSTLYIVDETYCQKKTDHEQGVAIVTVAKEIQHEACIDKHTLHYSLLPGLPLSVCL